MTNKLGKDLQSIVLGDQETTISLEDPTATGGIPSSRGVGTSAGGGVGFSGTVSSKDDEADKEKDGDSSRTDDQNREESDASGGQRDSKSTNPADYTRSPDAGEFDADKLIDGEEGPTLSMSEPDLFSGNSSLGALAGINATDCDTSKDLNIRVDGLFKPRPQIDYADGTIESAEWLDPAVPPEIPGFQSGFYWEVSGSGNPSPEQAATPRESAELAKAYLDANPAGGDVPPYNIVGLEADTASPPTLYTVYFEDSDSPPRDFTLTTGRISCSGTPPVDSGSCPVSPPVESQWPDDNQIDLRFDAGKFKASEYDADATVEYTGQNRSRIPFCMPGGRFGVVEAGVNGGKVLYETNTKDGTAKSNTIARYYDSQGNLKAAFDATSGVINDYLPRASD